MWSRITIDIVEWNKTTYIERNKNKIKSRMEER
jgi:hypothetical protein